MADPVQRQLRFDSPVGGPPVVLDFDQNGGKCIADMVRSMMNDIYEDQRATDEVVPADLDTEDFQAMEGMRKRFNKLVADKKGLKKGQTEVPKRGRPETLKDLLSLVYQLSIGDPRELNKYEPHSAATYGEASFEVMEEILKRVQLQPNATVVDLGSGVGQIVLQIAACAHVHKVYGIECEEIRSCFAKDMEKNFRSLMKWAGFIYSEFQLIEGNFMSQAYKHIINHAELIYTNNFKFDPKLNTDLEQVFMDQKQKTVIVSSSSFGERHVSRVTERNIYCFALYLDEKRSFSIKGNVSWSARAVTFHVQFFDIELGWKRLRKFYAAQEEVATTKRNNKGKKVVKEGSLKTDAASRTLPTASSGIDGSEISKDSIAEEEALVTKQPMKVAKGILADIFQESKKADECIPGQGCLDESVPATVEVAVQLDNLIPLNNDTATNQQPVGQESTPEPVPQMGDVEEENKDEGDYEPEVKKKRPSEEIHEGSRTNEMEEVDSGANTLMYQSDESLNVHVPERCAQQAESQQDVRNRETKSIPDGRNAVAETKQETSKEEVAKRGKPRCATGLNEQLSGADDAAEEIQRLRTVETTKMAKATAVGNEAPSGLEPQLEGFDQMRQQGSGDEIPSVKADTNKEQGLAQQEPLNLRSDASRRRVVQMHPDARNREMLAAQCTSIVPHVDKVDETSSTSTLTKNAGDVDMPKVPKAHEQRFSSVPADLVSKLAQDSDPQAEDLTVVPRVASADDPPGNVMQELPIMAARRRAFPRPVKGGCWRPGDYWPGVASSDLRFEVQGRIYQFRVTSMGVDCDMTEV